MTVLVLFHCITWHFLILEIYNYVYTPDHGDDQHVLMPSSMKEVKNRITKLVIMIIIIIIIVIIINTATVEPPFNKPLCNVDSSLFKE